MLLLVTFGDICWGETGGGICCEDVSQKWRDGILFVGCGTFDGVGFRVKLTP
jgi:hypothetical protein